MRKYLFVGGYRPFQNPTMGDILARRAMLGGNSGNLLFINAMFKALMIDDNTEFYPTYYRFDFSKEEIDYINQNFDAFVLPMADAFRDDNITYLTGLTRFIHQLSIPCYVIGVGLRAPYEPNLNQERKSDRCVSEFAKEILEHSALIGVRGEVTGEYLHRLGFSPEIDYTVIGCPSISVLLDPNMGVANDNIRVMDHKLFFERGCIIANTLANDKTNQFILDAMGDWDHVDVIAQKEMEEEAIYLGRWGAIYKGKFGAPENIFGNDLYNYLNDKGKILTFTNLEAWKRFMQGADICVSTRFHGGVVSIMSGVNTIIIPIDSRMRELCAYHRLPAIDNRCLYNTCIEEVIHNVSFDEWKTIWQENRERFISFLDKNDIIHTLNDTNESAYDRQVQDTNWEWQVSNWNSLSFDKRISRASDYFVGKLYGRINRQSITEKWSI